MTLAEEIIMIDYMIKKSSEATIKDYEAVKRQFIAIETEALVREAQKQKTA